MHARFLYENSKSKSCNKWKYTNLAKFKEQKSLPSSTWRLNASSAVVYTWRLPKNDNVKHSSYRANETCNFINAVENTTLVCEVSSDPSDVSSLIPKVLQFPPISLWGDLARFSIPEFRGPSPASWWSKTEGSTCILFCCYVYQIPKSFTSSIQIWAH